ncbi:MAG: ATP-dependent Clp protease proteolytic subunit [Clostridiales bacterium]|nr:ATP-dependent Clp protease proteolytic subunit [Clostridiales bacterium]
MANRKPINIYIDSFGGSLNAAFTIVDIIKNSKTPVYTINIGVCQKEALYPYLAGHKRYAYPRSSFYLDKNIERLDLSEGQSNYEDFIKKQALEVKDMVLEATKITETDYENRKGWWLTADKANELLVCHEVLRNKII